MRYDDPYEQIREMNRHLERLREPIRGPLDEINEVFRRQQELYRLPLTRLEEFVNEATRSSRPIEDSMQLAIAAAKGTLASTETLEAMPGLEAVQAWKSHFQESVDSATRTLRESCQESVDSAARTIRGLELREMNFVADGLYDQARRYIELEDSVQRQARQHIQDWEHVGITSAIRQFAGMNEDWTRTIAEVAGRLTSAFALARSADFEELNRRAEMLRDLTSGSAVFDMLARELASSASAGALTPALAGGFGGELLGYIEGTQAADSEKAIAKFLKALLIWLLDLAQRLPGTKLSNEAILSIFVTVAVLLYEQHSSDKMEQRLREEIREVREEARQNHEEDLKVVRESHEENLKEMREMEARFMERLGQAQIKDDDAKEYVVIKAAKLRTGPGKDFESTRVLPPNLQVEEIKRDSEWSHVRYFDYVEGGLREGWISTALMVAKQDDDQL